MSEERRLARAHCTYQSRRGGKIRNEQGPEPSVEKFGFHPVQGNQWLWKAAISCKWHLDIDHISALEVPSVTLGAWMESPQCEALLQAFPSPV